MIDPENELKVRAELLHTRVAEGDANALARLRALPEFRDASDADLEAAAPGVRRKHCLAVIGRELGFTGWAHALRYLRAAPDESDFGTLLYARGCAGTLNQWFTTYDEARAVHAERGGYLLAYKRHFVIVGAAYVESLGLDPDDDDWEKIGFDWVRPREADARRRLLAKVLQHRA